MAERLDPSGRPVRLDGVILRTPGLDGVAGVRRPGEESVGGAEDSWEPLDEALRRQDAETERIVEIGDSSESVAAPGPTQLTVPAPAEGMEQVVLLKDEADVLTWHFADAPEEGHSTSESVAAPTRTYTLPSRVPDTTGGEEGLFTGAIGKKILKVIAFRVLDEALGKVGDFFAGKWEKRHRPYRCRTFSSADYTDPAAREIDGDGWGRLREDRALLLIHGTFSRANTGFGKLPREFVDRLTAHYDGRVFALDHPTLSESPDENADWLLSQIPSGAPLEVDVICHSRGGLVTRVLAEQLSAQAGGSPQLDVQRVVFVATPNAGTVLADFDHLGDLIDSYTNLLNFVPDVGVTDTLETIVTVVKMIAVGGLKGLDGLTAMTPGGKFLSGLNAGDGGGAAYHALAADFEPAGPGLREWASDQLMDPLFDKAGNDLVVPTDGVWSENGSARFPIEERQVFETTAGVAHTGFFGQRRTQDAIAGWLGV